MSDDEIMKEALMLLVRELQQKRIDNSMRIAKRDAVGTLAYQIIGDLNPSFEQMMVSFKRSLELRKGGLLSSLDEKQIRHAFQELIEAVSSVPHNYIELINEAIEETAKTHPPHKAELYIY